MIIAIVIDKKWTDSLALTESLNVSIPYWSLVGNEGIFCSDDVPLFPIITPSEQRIRRLANQLRGRQILGQAAFSLGSAGGGQQEEWS